MYKNRISRNNKNSHPKFFIRRSDIAFDERVAYVESVCASLVESRFGPGRVDPCIINLSERPKLDPAVFYDLCDDGEAVPCYALSPLGRNGFQVVEAAYRRAKQMGLLATGPNARSGLTADTSSNLGRGSP